MENNKITCVNCGHVNFLNTKPVALKFAELRKSDVGLEAGLNENRSDYIVLSFEKNADTTRRHHHTINFFDPSADPLHEPDTMTRFFYNEDDVIYVWRPID
jgi:hypothetical protein